MTDKRDKAIALTHQQRFADALVLFKQLLATDPDDWSLVYMAGQCCRFQNDLKGAINYLKRAVTINAREPRIMLALGIAQQLNREFVEAIESLRQAIELDPDYVIAYNSLALTQQKTGDLEHALHNYDAGVKALSRSIVKKMNNSRANDIYKHRDSRQNLWVERNVQHLVRCIFVVCPVALTVLHGLLVSKRQKRNALSGTPAYIGLTKELMIIKTHAFFYQTILIRSAKHCEWTQYTQILLAAWVQFLNHWVNRLRQESTLRKLRISIQWSK